MQHLLSIVFVLSSVFVFPMILKIIFGVLTEAFNLTAENNNKSQSIEGSFQKQFFPVFPIFQLATVSFSKRCMFQGRAMMQ